MELYLFSILILLFSKGLCDSYIQTSYRLRLAVPGEYSNGFIGRAFLMESNQTEPRFRTALSIDALDGRYSCSLEVFLGDVKVWNSGHYSRFFTSEVCLLELTEDGDLRLKGPQEKVGWRTGTSGQGVERMQILETGNLVLVDALNSIKWQSFNFPTDIMLWGQRLDLATRLTSFPGNSTSFYTFEIEPNKIGLYLNSGQLKYSYWEFKPSKSRNLTFVQLGSRGLLLFNDKSKKIAQIPSGRSQPLRFLALGNRTGNLGLYFYSPYKRQFEASFQALNSTCDLPLACNPYGICTFSNACSCIRFSARERSESSSCSKGIPAEFCGGGPVEMLELQDINSIMKGAPVKVNISKEACSSLCLHDCKCLAGLYSSDTRECFLYGQAVGIKQVERGTGLSYIVKVPKGINTNHSKFGVKKWVLVVVVVVDGLVILLIMGGLAYYLIQKKRKNSTGTNMDT